MIADATKMAKDEVTAKLVRAENRERRTIRRSFGDRIREMPTASSIRAAFESAMKQFAGFDSTGNQDDQFPQYAHMKSERYKKAVAGGLRPFIKGSDYTFMVDVLKTLPVRKRRQVIQNVLLAFTDDSKAVLSRPEVQHEISDSTMTMTKADAVQLFFVGNYSQEQWDNMATAVNKLAKDKLRKKFGRIIPCCKTLNRHLEEVGAKLGNDDISVIHLDQEEVIDLTLVEQDSEEVKEVDEEIPQRRAAFVKDVMGRLVVPELQSIHKFLPRVFARMKKSGKVDIVLAIDNTSRQNFVAMCLKLEQAVIKIILPGIESAQQSPALAIPIFFMEGDETYVSLHKVVTKQMRENFKKQVDVPLSSGQGTCTLSVNWHLCSDHQLVALLGGFGGSGCNKPCFICNWDRTDPFGNVGIRTEADLFKKTQWAEKFLKPIHESQTELKLASKKVNAGKSCKANANAADESQRMEVARGKRDKAFKDVGVLLKGSPDHELAQLLNNCQRLQPRIAGLAKKHLKRAEGPCVCELEADLQAAHERVRVAEGIVKASTDHLAHLESMLATFDEAVHGEEGLETLLQRIDDEQENLEREEESLSGQLDAWAYEVDKANALDDVVVKVVTDKRTKAEKVRVFHPSLDFTNMSTELLQGLLVEACEGVYRACMVQDIIPSSRWYVEALHLIINTGNSWIELCRNTFQYLLTPECKVRDRMECPPESWERATSSSRQTKAWREAGFDFEGFVKGVLGSKLAKPLTKFHGSQIEAVFRRRDELWAAEPLRSGIEALKKDPEVSQLVGDLIGIFDNLSTVHKQVSIPNPDLQALRAAKTAFLSRVKTFEFEGTPAPCRYRLKFYDHAVISHVCDMSAALKEQGLSLAVVSSKFLEANNKVVKAVMRRLPGGGKRRDGSYAHLPLVQGLKRCVAASFVKRQALYMEMSEGQGECIACMLD